MSSFCDKSKDGDGPLEFVNICTFSWSSAVVLFCTFSWRMYWCTIHVVGCCINFNMPSISTEQIPYCDQQKDGDRNSGCMNSDKAVMPTIHHFSPHVQATQLYRAMSLYAIWVCPEYCLKTEASQNILESKTKKLSTCCNSMVYSSGFP
jgi:hypothetical protein